MDKNIVWVLNKLITVGGGEKLMLEGVEHYRKLGYKVTIITWEFSTQALFDGRFSDEGIVVFEEKSTERSDILKRSYVRIKSLLKMRALLKKISPELIITQGEYDVAICYLATLFTPMRYSFLIFGQIFQYPHDLGKYSLIFKKHLQTIINSQKGYKETIPLVKPKSSFLNSLANEFISVIRYFAVRKAVQRFTFSSSVSWETKLLFNVPTQRLQGAFHENIFLEEFNDEQVKKLFNIPLNKKTLLSFSRLDKKKRIEVIVKSMQYLDKEFILIVAGKGECENELKELVKTLGLESRVFLLGYIQEHEANALKAVCEIFISMDIGDFDISPLEALALGSKAIVAKEFDLDEHLKKVVSLYSVEAEPEVLSKAIIKAYSNDKDLSYISVLQNYTWEKYFDSILKLSSKND